jgi:hypothetical protein
MHRPYDCNFADEPIAIDGPIATQREPIAT